MNCYEHQKHATQGYEKERYNNIFGLDIWFGSMKFSRVLLYWL